MRLEPEDLTWAAKKGVISPEQAGELWELLQKRKRHEPRFELTQVLYYLGAMIVMGALGWFMNSAWERAGGAALTGLAVLYAALFIAGGRRLWFAEGLLIPGGLLFCLAVWMTPLAVYGLQHYLGWWAEAEAWAYRDYFQWVGEGRFWMELSTILAGLLALRYVRFPFLIFPMALALWLMSLDLAQIALQPGADEAVRLRKLVSLGLGLAMLSAAYLGDRRTREDYSFWGYLFGLAAFWGGLSSLEPGGELDRLIYGLINLGLIAISVLFRRQVFLLFGAAGLFSYLGHLALKVFDDALLFSPLLALAGLGLIYAGVKYHRHRRVIQDTIEKRIPRGLLKYLPAHRKSAL